MVKDDCIFCKIAKGDIPSATVYETNELRAFLDVAPANKGHVLIVPKEHYDNIFQIDAETAGKIFSLGTEIARAMKDELQVDGMNVLQNNGEVAGQTVHHFHLHLIPRFKGDKVTITWPQMTTESDEQIKLAEAIKKRI